MSRIGRMPVAVPAGVDVKLDGKTLTVKGPKGTLTQELHQDMIVEVGAGEITVAHPRTDTASACRPWNLLKK